MVNNGITMAIFMVVNGYNYGISTFISWDIILQLYRGSSSQVRSQGRSKTAVINVKTTGTRLLDSNHQKIEKFDPTKIAVNYFHLFGSDYTMTIQQGPN